MQEKEQKISPVKQRILSFAASLKISKREFYNKIGVSRGTLESTSGITEDIVAKFIAIYPEVDVNWLITGEGTMRKVAQKSVPSIVSPQQDVGIPLIPFHAMAGILSGEQTAMEYDCERYVVPAFRKADYLIQIRGNSMTPTYLSGDIVACQRVTMGHFFQWNEAYVLDTDQGVIIKRVKRGTDAEHLLIISDNPDYEPFELHHSEVYHMALVQGIIRSS